ncbi:hypothetical protein [Dolosicoccus paucivorans]
MNEKFGRWSVLYFHRIKQDYKKLILWLLGLGLFCAGFVPAFEELAKGSGASGMYYISQNPAMASMVGPTPVKEAADYTLGAMYSHEMLLFCALLSFILSSLYVVSRTRKEEDSGILELTRSFPIGRLANSLATLLLTITVNLLLILFIGLVMTGFKADTITLEGSFYLLLPLG